MTAAKPGTVYLVGAGPGDPGLLTLRGAELLASCEVVVYDRLAPRELLQMVPGDAERIDVGKRPSAASSSFDQDEINSILVAKASESRKVVRLKGGDPFVFGRGGEEAQALAAAGVVFEVVPGVSAAFAVPAYAGIPVTNRGMSRSVTVVTGHGEDGEPGVDWEGFATTGGTLVILMGVTHRAEIARRLISGGMPPSTPVAVVRWGSRADQSTIRTTLAALGDAPVRPPATIVVGEVAGVDLSWYETKPLFGWRVVVTRAPEQASSLSAALRAEGAAVVELPVIAFADPIDGGAELTAAVERLDDFAWVVFTSANAVRRVFEAIASSGRDSRAFGSVKVAAIGKGTAAALASRGIVADLMPESFVAESLLQAFPLAPEASGDAPPVASRARVLVPRAAVARDVLPGGLRAKGWQVEVVDAYRTERPEIGSEIARDAAGAHAVCFTSASTVDGYVEQCGVDRVPPVIACIGPVTAERVRIHGLDPDLVAAEHSIPALVGALASYAASHQRPAGPRS